MTFKLDKIRMSNLCDMTGIPLWPHSSFSFDFTGINKANLSDTLVCRVH